jgi:hypothetical protein
MHKTIRYMYWLINAIIDLYYGWLALYIAPPTLLKYHQTQGRMKVVNLVLV